MITLDHLAVAGSTLDLATTYVETSLGVPLEEGGAHAVFHTHNRLLGIEEGLYLEAIAINPDASAPDRPRWFDLDRFTGPARLTNWICRCDDLDATLAALPPGFGTPVALQRGTLRWRMAVPADGILPFDNCAPALMQWEGDDHPAERLAQLGAAFTGLTVCHPDADDLAALLAPHLSDARIRFERGTAGLQADIAVEGQARRLT
ncbi:Glyoxalase 3 domain containing protein [Sulfitobacter noctilucae]|uniref:VOC family protein n=1 Tax=Sulfitobacter noctilucae TaxID=1342302 RepID=UPI000468437A|nr:VOC family protein [Sulfitobacter noctilucae]KIN61695.1 Glyoxalase 3 domain containing protein [Sulfitobacter noctilucae]